MASPTEVDERAFSLYVLDGIRYFMENNPSLYQYTVIQYISRLYRAWSELPMDEKEPWLERAREQIQELRTQYIIRRDHFSSRIS